MPSCHSHIAQRNQRHQLHRVIGQHFIANLGEAELALDHPQWVFHFGAHTGFELLCLFAQRAPTRVLVCLAFARSHRKVPIHACHSRPVDGTLITGIGKHDRFFAMQLAVSLSHFLDIGSRADDGVHQTAVSIHAHVRLHPETPLIALLARMHLWVALAIPGLRRTRRGNKRCVHGAALPEQQALTAQQLIDSRQHAIGQLVFLQPVAKSEDGALVRQAPVRHPAGQTRGTAARQRRPLPWLSPTGQTTAGENARAAWSPMQTGVCRSCPRGSRGR